MNHNGKTSATTSVIFTRPFPPCTLSLYVGERLLNPYTACTLTDPGKGCKKPYVRGDVNLSITFPAWAASVTWILRVEPRKICRTSDHVTALTHVTESYFAFLNIKKKFLMHLSINLAVAATNPLLIRRFSIYNMQPCLAAQHPMQLWFAA